MFRVEEINFPKKQVVTNFFFPNLMTHFSSKSKPISLAVIMGDRAGGLLRKYKLEHNNNKEHVKFDVINVRHDVDVQKSVAPSDSWT